MKTESSAPRPPPHLSPVSSSCRTASHRSSVFNRPSQALPPSAEIHRNFLKQTLLSHAPARVCSERWLWSNPTPCQLVLLRSRDRAPSHAPVAGHLAAICNIIRARGFAVAAERSVVLDDSLAAALYEQHRGKDFYHRCVRAAAAASAVNTLQSARRARYVHARDVRVMPVGRLTAFMTSGRSHAMILQAPVTPSTCSRAWNRGFRFESYLAMQDAVQAWRALMGPTNSAAARAADAQSIRALYGTDGACGGEVQCESVTIGNVCGRAGGVKRRPHAL